LYEHVWLTIRSRLWYHAQVCVKKIDYSETKKEKNISSSEYRVNNSIRVPQVRLIDAGGENIGIVSTADALRMAEEADLDLVEQTPRFVG
jgi:hypothetical protein